MNSSAKNIVTTVFAVLTLFLAGLLLVTVSNMSRRETIHISLTPDEARRIMNENDSYVLLDVRTPEEFSHIRMNDAILMSDYEIMERAEVELDKNDIILVYCQSGRRSAEVTHELIALGFKRVYDIGGIVDWPWPQDLIKE